MNRAERRFRTRKVVKQRKEKIKLFNSSYNKSIDILEENDICEGQLKNNNELNALSHRGKARKTKAKHGHSSYRHKGTYGTAKVYKPREQRQIDCINQSENS